MATATAHFSAASGQRPSFWIGTPEIYFNKVIDNSRLVKVEDPRRSREMRQFGVALACLFLLVMTYAWQHFKAIEYGYQIESLKIQRDGMVEMNRELHLEDASLRNPERIDAMARKLGLQSPQDNKRRISTEGCLCPSPGNLYLAASEHLGAAMFVSAIGGKRNRSWLAPATARIVGSICWEVSLFSGSASSACAWSTCRFFATGIFSSAPRNNSNARSMSRPSAASSTTVRATNWRCRFSWTQPLPCPAKFPTCQTLSRSLPASAAATRAWCSPTAAPTRPSAGWRAKRTPTSSSGSAL